MSTTPLAGAARALLPWIVERRRHLHRNPELSFREEKTSAFVEKELRALGYDRLHTRLNGSYSLCAELIGRDSSRTMALRADMDALPIQELTEGPFKSQADGVSHMCGHDAHTAMLLGAARLLKERESELPCNVRLFFQAGEEKLPGGALDIIKAGFLNGVEFVFGLHVDPLNNTGVIEITEGRLMAGIDEFTITIHGKGGHAGYPHHAVDPVIAAAHVVTALQQIMSRAKDPFEPGVLSVTQIHTGHACNVIPESASINGTLRSYREDWHEHYGALMRRTASHVAEAFGCRAECEILKGYPPLLNDAAAANTMRRAARDVFDAERIVKAEPVMGAEDFAHYLRHAPGCFAFLGVAAPEDQERYFLHHPKFHLDEQALWSGAALLARVGMGA